MRRRLLPGLALLLLAIAAAGCQGQAPAALPLPDSAYPRESAPVAPAGEPLAFAPQPAPVAEDAAVTATTVADQPLRRPDPAIPPVPAADTLAAEPAVVAMDDSGSGNDTTTISLEEPLTLVAASAGRAKPLGESAAALEEQAPPADALVDEGVASTYGTGDGFQGNLTACGQVFDTYVPQVAHKTLPCGTLLRVEDVATGQSVTVPVTDRGPYITGRVVDLSWAAFQQLDASGPGLLDVRVYRVP